MSAMKALKFVALPERSRDPVENRRKNILNKLAEQLALAKDPNFVRVTQRFTGKGEERHAVRVESRIRPWFRADAAGGFAMAVYVGPRPLELAQGKAAVAVSSRDELPKVIETLIEATRAGELGKVLNLLGIW